MADIDKVADIASGGVAVAKAALMDPSTNVGKVLKAIVSLPASAGATDQAVSDAFLTACTGTCLDDYTNLLSGAPAAAPPPVVPPPAVVPPPVVPPPPTAPPTLPPFLTRPPVPPAVVPPTPASPTAPVAPTAPTAPAGQIRGLRFMARLSFPFGTPITPTQTNSPNGEGATQKNAVPLWQVIGIEGLIGGKYYLSSGIVKFGALAGVDKLWGTTSIADGFGNQIQETAGMGLGYVGIDVGYVHKVASRVYLGGDFKFRIDIPFSTDFSVGQSTAFSEGGLYSHDFTFGDTFTVLGALQLHAQFVPTSPIAFILSIGGGYQRFVDQQDSGLRLNVDGSGGVGKLTLGLEY